MNSSTPPIAIRNVSAASVLSRPIGMSDAPPVLLPRQAPRRSKIWEFNTNLHCSIIGTCLSTTELRQILKKLGVAARDCTDHELHGVGVSLAGRHDDGGRAIHKALDQRHKLTVSQFDKAGSAEALRGLWRDAVSRGDIPGAYWATLTHPQASPAIIREAFGDVHMLSHLVGSANRADLRRLCVLEAEKAELEEKVHGLRQAMHEAMAGRDTQIAALRQALASRQMAEATTVAPADDTMLRGVIADRERRLAAEVGRRAGLEERVAGMLAERDAERAGRLAAEQREADLREELAAVEASVAAPVPEAAVHRLDGMTLLYVGGRPNQVAHLRAMVDELGGVLLHHDGGVENHQNLLPGLASRCDVAMFPVDCVSHDAANMVKSLCRKAGKRFIPLRSAGVTSLLAALRTSDLAALRRAAA